MPAYVNPHTRFIDKSFNETHTQSYILSMQIGLHGLVFSVYHPEENKFIVLESFRFVGIKNSDHIGDEIDSVIEDRKWLSKKFKGVNIIYEDQNCTLVPSALFVKNEKQSFLDFNQPLNKNISVQFNQIKNAGLVNIFSISDALSQKVRTVWLNNSIFHASTIFIESILIHYKNKADKNSLFIYLHKDYFELVYLKNSKLFFHNSFKFKSKEDFIYFLLAAIEQLGLNPETVKLKLLGDFHKNSIFYEMVYQYIRHSEFISKNDTFTYSRLLDNIAHHQFYILFNVLQCE